MADEVIDLLEPQVREMLRILSISDKDAEVRKLILRLGETIQKHYLEKDGEAGIASCPIDFVSLETPPPTPPSMQKDTKSLRRSSRLAFHPPNQSYKSKQGRHRISKRQRCGSKQSRRHKDGQIESKMVKAHHMEEIREARKAELEKRMEIRKAKLQGRRRRDKKLMLGSVQPAINDSANCEPANDGPTIDHTMIEPTFCDPSSLNLPTANLPTTNLKTTNLKTANLPLTTP